MATPQYEAGQVALRGTPTQARTGPGAEAFGGQIGRAAQGLGQEVAQVSDTTERMADLAAETRVREADVALSTRIQEETVTGDNALMKLQGQAFVDAAPTVLKRLQDHARELTAKPRNGLEARMLEDLTARRLASTAEQINGQAIREQQFAAKAAATARTQVMGASAAYSYRDPKAYAQARAELDAAARDELQSKGISDPVSFQALRQEKLTGVHAYAIQDMMRLGETGPAQTWLDNAVIKQEIDPATAARMQDMLEKATTENEITNLVEGQAPPSIVDGRVDRAPPELVSAVVFQESRGDGMAVSPKGAQGVAQVMPATGPEAARLAGLAWEPARMTSRQPKDIEYQKALGTAYLNAKLKEYGGNVVLALAAYNAGSKRVDAWLKTNGDPRTGQISGSAWAAKIPFAETKDYVAKITAKLGGTTRAPLPPGIMDVGEAETWAQQFPAKDRDKARSAALAVVSRNRTAKNQRESDTWDAVQPYLRNGGNWTSIPKVLWNRMDPEHQTALMEAERKGTDRVTTPEVFDGIMSLMEKNPKGFADMDLLKAAPDLSKSDFEQVRMWQHQARTGSGEWKRPAAQYTAITRLAPSIVPPSMLKATGKADLNLLKSRWYQAMQLKQETSKEPLTDDEIADIGAKLIAQTAVSGGFMGGRNEPLFKFGTNGGMVPTAEYKAIPAAEQSQVFRFLEKRNGRVPSTAEVLETWRTLKATGDL